MKTLKEIKSIVKQQDEFLKQKYKVKELSIFGSYVKGKQKESSDIDILVEFAEPVSLLQMISLENYLKDILETNVEVVPKKDLRKELKDTILNEAVPL